eukprot:6185961-Ditylum_brightwellii.AAC.1
MQYKSLQVSTFAKFNFSHCPNKATLPFSKSAKCLNQMRCTPPGKNPCNKESTEMAIPISKGMYDEKIPH